MKSIEKKIACIVLTLVMAMSAISANASTATSAESDSDYMLWHAEFDGNDDQSKWVKTTYTCTGNEVYDPAMITIEDGYSIIDNTKYSGRRIGAQFEPPISLENKQNIYFETRFKFEGEGETAITKTHIFCINGECTQNAAKNKPFISVNIINGKLQFAQGGTNGGIASDYAIEKNKWYTIKVQLNFVTKKAYVEAADENGQKTTGEIGYLWGLPWYNITAVSATPSSDDSSLKIITDYARLYDADLVPTAEVVYGDNHTSLADAVGVPTSFDGTIIFPSAVTESDIENISLSAGTISGKKLSEDKKSLAFNVSGLEKRTQYALNIGTMGLSEAKTIKFVTEDRPEYLFRAEFDGLDDTSLWTPNPASAKIEDGALSFDYDKLYYRFQKFEADFTKDGENGVSTIDENNALKKNICFETKILFNTNVSFEKTIFQMKACMQSNLAYKPEIIKIGLTNGQLKLNDTVIDPDHTISTDCWYTIKGRVDFKDRKVYVEIYNNDVKELSAEKEMLVKSDFHYITSITATPLCDKAGESFKTDYVRLWDDELIPSVTVTYGTNDTEMDGAKKIGKSVVAKAVFPNAITEADVEKITINNGAVLKRTLSDDRKTVTLDISGLNYHQKYTISIPKIEGTKTKDVIFYTAEDPEYLFRAEFDGLDDTTYWAKLDYAGNFANKEMLGRVENGMLITDYVASNGRWGVNYGVGDEALHIDSWEKNICLETKFKIATTDTSLTVPPSQTYLTIWGTELSERNQQDFSYFQIKSNNGKLSLGNIAFEDTEYDIKFDTWYTVKVIINYEKRRTDVYVEGDDGTEYKGITKFSYGFAYENINRISLHKNADNNVTYTTDYIRLWKNNSAAPIEFSADQPVFDKEIAAVGEPLKVTVNYESPDVRDIALIAAVYDGGERVVGFSKLDTKTDITNIGKLEMTITPENGAAKIKVFVWDSVNGMIPYAKSNAITVRAAN